MSVLCNGTETAAMVLSDEGCYRTITVREAAILAGGWHKIIDMEHQFDLPNDAAVDVRRLSGIALQGRLVYFTANSAGKAGGTMKVGRVSSVCGPGQYEVTWCDEVISHKLHMILFLLTTP